MSEFLDLLDICITDKNATCIQGALEAFLGSLSSTGCCIVRDACIWAEVMFQYSCLFGMLCDGIHTSLQQSSPVEGAARASTGTSSSTTEAHYRIRKMGNQAKRSLGVLQLLTCSKPEIPWSEEDIQLELDALNTQRSEGDIFKLKACRDHPLPYRIHLFFCLIVLRACRSC